MGVCKESSTFITLPISRQSSAALFTTVPFGFDAKTSFDASTNLTLTRSETFQLKPKIKEVDIWHKMPPDFRLQLYQPRPLKLQSRATNPRLLPGEKHRPIKREQTHPRLNKPKPVDLTVPFFTSFAMVDSFSAKSLHASCGRYPSGPYVPPLRHDFRDLVPVKTQGIDEFRTDHERDVGDIKFKTQRLDVFYGLRQPSSGRRLAGEIMGPVLQPSPFWDKSLILDNERYPNKSGAYSRFRPLVRSPHSAFMERVENKVTQEWSEDGNKRIT